MKTVVVIPTYNERGNVSSLIERLVALPLALDFFFIDDGSPDGTGSLLDSFSMAYPRLRVMHRSGKFGLGSAYRQAFHLLLAEPYDRFVAMDADLSHRPESIPALLQSADAADLVIGSRYQPGGEIRNWPLARRLLSRTANLVARGTLGLVSKDSTSGFRCYRREVLEVLGGLDIRSNGYSFLVETVYYAQVMGFRVREEPILFEDRVHSKSKMSRSEIMNAIRTVLRLSLQRIRGKGVRGRMKHGSERSLESGYATGLVRTGDLPSGESLGMEGRRTSPPVSH